jgi:hypothetical protein
MSSRLNKAGLSFRQSVFAEHCMADSHREMSRAHDQFRQSRARVVRQRSPRGLRRAGFLTSSQNTAKFNRGGEEEDRTPDLRIANATLSQLSYPPNVS